MAGKKARVHAPGKVEQWDQFTKCGLRSTGSKGCSALSVTGVHGCVTPVDCEDCIAGRPSRRRR